MRGLWRGVSLACNDVLMLFSLFYKFKCAYLSYFLVLFWLALLHRNGFAVGVCMVERVVVRDSLDTSMTE